MVKEKLLFAQPDGIVPDSNPCDTLICALANENAIKNNSNRVFIILDFKVWDKTNKWTILNWRQVYQTRFSVYETIKQEKTQVGITNYISQKAITPIYIS